MKISQFLPHLVVLIISVFSSVSSSSNAIQVKLKSQNSWVSPQPILEYLEFLKEEPNQSLYTALDFFIKHDLLKESYTPAQLYGILVENESLVSLLLASPSSLSVLKMYLASRSATPRVEAFFHYYREYILSTKSLSEFDSRCPVWLLWNNVQKCSLDKLPTLSNHDYDVFGFDQVYGKDHLPLVILYASIAHPTFPSFYDYLKKRAADGELRFIVRYIPSTNGSTTISNPVGLSGYGVELAIKNTEYKVQDDRALDASGSSDSDGNISSQEEDDALFSQEPIIAAVGDDEKTDLGARLVSYILNASNPIRALATATQDFPRYTHLFKVPVLPQVQEAVTFFHSGKNEILPNSLSINGFRIEASELDPFKILELLRSETQIMKTFSEAGISTTDALDFVSTGSIVRPGSGNDVSWGETFDIRSKHIFWLNNLEKEKRYNQFQKSIYGLMQPSYGNMKFLRKNLYNVVFFIDPLDDNHLKIVEDAATFIKRLFPLRFGVVFLPENDGDKEHLSTKAAKIAYTAARTKNRATVMSFVETMRHVLKDGPLTPKALDTVCQKVLKMDLNAFAAKSDEDTEVDSMEDIAAYSARFAVTRSVGGGLFANGKYYELKAGWEQTALQDSYKPMLEHLMMKLYTAEIDDSTDIYKYFMTLPSALKFRNVFITINDKQPARLVDLTATMPDTSLLKKLPWLYGAANEAESNNDTGVNHEVSSVVFFGDFSNSGLEEHVQRVARLLSSSSRYRFTVLSTTSSSDNDRTRSKVAKVASVFEKLSIEGATLESVPEVFETSINSSQSSLTEEERRSILKAYDVPLEHTALAINGRVILFPQNANFLNEEEVSFLLEYENNQRIETMSEIFREKRAADAIGTLSSNATREDVAHVFLLVSATATLHQKTAVFSVYGGESVQRTSPHILDILNDKDILIKHGHENAPLHMTAVVDPLTKAGQRLAAILKSFINVDQVFLQIYLIPSVIDSFAKLPLDRFYRFVWPAEPTFDANGGYQAPQATFKRIPVDPVLTLGLDLPDSWLVRPKQSVYDLDNIKLKNVKSDVNAIFELQNILVQGHAANKEDGAPPRGLQFVLGSINDPELVDTITMFNLGYLQLKANPGVWQFKIRDGRSSEVYEINGVYESEKQTKASELLLREGKALVIVNSFQGGTIYPVVQKRPGMEQESLLDEQEKGDAADSKDAKSKESIWDSFKKSFLGTKSKNGKDANSKKEKDLNENTINVFSVASGHLYERFLSIMTLSVTRQTKSRVRFWLIENFLSPSFLDFLPYLAKAVGFEYELITYKWPKWLNAQTEKQRIIWAYKILFLDVMFPLKLDKVIFVDADQVVRTDLKELVDMDLKGAVYGYTPFCNDRPEVDEFRFWKSGYWKSHLGGRPYHISALYVVDLVRFRAIAAGDRLRGQYHMLSQDSGSLANLDQDLPNNMIHEIPMFSLPQEWLWCETWCSDASLAKAKTIDLCNNPLTKEPKLDRARRILPEWEGLDKDIQTIREEYERQKYGKAPASSTTSPTKSKTTSLVRQEDDSEEKHEDL